MVRPKHQIASRAKEQLVNWLLEKTNKRSGRSRTKYNWDSIYTASLDAFTVIGQYARRYVLGIIETISVRRLRQIRCFQTHAAHLEFISVNSAFHDLLSLTQPTVASSGTLL